MRVVGKGSFGKVMQVKMKKTGKIFAMKMLSKQHIVENNEIEHTMAERAILEKIRHPFLVNLNYSFQSEDKLYFILDFVNGGELFFHLQKEKRFSFERTRFYAAEILLALEALHSAGVLYRDLKPEHMLLHCDGHISVTDFGLCKQGLNAPNAKTDTFCGTPEYLAPEVLLGQGYGKAVDWWSFGSLLFEMLTGLVCFFFSLLLFLHSHHSILKMCKRCTGELSTISLRSLHM
jgi:RAC serine/threonine-protein kinase